MLSVKAGCTPVPRQPLESRIMSVGCILFTRPRYPNGAQMQAKLDGTKKEIVRAMAELLWGLVFNFSSSGRF